MPLNRENRRRQIILNVTPYIIEVDDIALSLINQFRADGADPEVTKLDDYKLSLTFRESAELTYEVACQKILWNQYVQNIEQKNIATNIELLRKMIDPYFDSPVVASNSEVLGDGKGQLDGISPSAFSDGEVLWANGKPIKQPSYSIGDEEVRVPAGGPLPLSRNLDKDTEPSTITASSEGVLPNPKNPEDLFGHLLQHHPDIIENYTYETPGSPYYKDALREIAQSMTNQGDPGDWYPGSYKQWQHEHNWWHGKTGLWGGPMPDETDLYIDHEIDIPHEHEQ